MNIKLILCITIFTNCFNMNAMRTRPIPWHSHSVGIAYLATSKNAPCVPQELIHNNEKNTQTNNREPHHQQPQQTEDKKDH